MVTGFQVLYSLALIVILNLMEQDYFKSDSSLFVIFTHFHIEQKKRGFCGL